MKSAGRLMVSVFLPLAVTVAACAQYPVQTGVVGYQFPVLAAEISPSGARLGVIEATKLKTVGLRDDGLVASPGDPTEIELPGILHMKFTPNGRKIICADVRGQIHIIARDDWSVVTLQTVDGRIPAAVDAIDDPPLAFVHYYDTGRTTVVDYRAGDVFQYLDAWDRALSGSWHGRDICVAPDGHTLYRLYSRGNPVEASAIEAVDFAHDTLPVRHRKLWELEMESLVACCPGPDDHHLMAMDLTGRDLCVIARVSGRVVERIPLPVARAVDLDYSADGNWAVVTAHDPLRLYVLSGADLRALVAPDATMDPARVRWADVRQLQRPRGCCLHPTKNIAYVYNAVIGSVGIFELHVPGVQ